LFCRQCAYDRYSLGKTDCASCGLPTDGIFNEFSIDALPKR
jgi:ribosomal protein L37E